MNEILDLINTLKKQFNVNEIKDYQNLILIIYNSLFIYEDLLTPQIKYELIILLNSIIEKINNYNSNPLFNNIIDDYNLLVSNKLQEYIGEF